MAHFARINKATNIVLQVHVVNNSNTVNSNNQEDENIGISFLLSVHQQQPWINDIYFKQTSYSSKIRKNYAGVGYFYDKVKDAFIAPKPNIAGTGKTGDFILNEVSCQWEFVNS